MNARPPARGMPVPDMDVVYVVPSNFTEMTLTPGQYLEVELARLKVDKTELAKRLGVKYQTVLQWAKDRGGFSGPSEHNRANRARAAEALGLDPKHFDSPNASALHQEKCRQALEAFLSSPLAPKQSPITESELANLRNTSPPLEREPTPMFYAGHLYLIRGELPPSNLARELDENEALARSLSEKLQKAYESAVQAKPPRKKKGAKKPPKPGKSHK